MAVEKSKQNSAFVPWENLSLDERLYIWWFDNQEKMGRQSEQYKRFLEDFTEQYEEPSLEAYLHFKYELREYQLPELLLDGFFAVYATSAEELGVNGAEPRYRLTTYIKVAETYFSSREDALADQEHFEAMEGLEPMNYYRIEKLKTGGK